MTFGRRRSKKTTQRTSSNRARMNSECLLTKFTVPAWGNRRRCNTKIHAFRMSETYLNRRKVLKEMTSVGQWRRITTAISLRRFVPGHGGHPALLHLRGNGSKGLPSVRPEVPLLHPQKFVRHQTRHTTTALQACDLRVIGNKSNLPRRRAARRNPVW